MLVTAGVRRLERRLLEGHQLLWQEMLLNELNFHFKASFGPLPVFL